MRLLGALGLAAALRADGATCRSAEPGWAALQGDLFEPVLADAASPGPPKNQTPGTPEDSTVRKDETCREVRPRCGS